MNEGDESDEREALDLDLYGPTKLVARFTGKDGAERFVLAVNGCEPRRYKSLDLDEHGTNWRVDRTVSETPETP